MSPAKTPAPTPAPTKSQAKSPAKPAAPAKPTATRTGVVEAAGRDKSRTVVVRFQQRHPKYGKYLKKQTVLQVHDEKNESSAGDTVEIAQCRPMSRTKSWRLVRVVERRPGQ